MNLLQSLPVTSLCALALGLWMFILTARVIFYRRAHSVVLGAGDDRVMEKRIRAHGNAAEQIPIALILLAFSELGGANTHWLTLIAIVLIIGRIMHGLYFTVHGLHWRWRFYGMSLTLAAQAMLIGTLGSLLVSG